jgi:hypothetical protein
MAVVNTGISGNRVLHDGAGVNALARFDRDVLAQPGVVNLIGEGRSKTYVGGKRRGSCLDGVAQVSSRFCGKAS